jgi:chromosome segregation ATPase
MTNDRNYLRMLSDSELIRLAVDSYNETSIVLAERLSALLDIEEQLEDAKREIDELNARLDRWMEQANTLQAQLEAK